MGITIAIKTIFLLALVGGQACTAQPGLNTMPVPYQAKPPIPTMEALDDLDLTDQTALTIEETRDSLGIITRQYFLKDLPFSGWTKAVFLDTDHRYRYVRYESGFPVWQIGYYDNGEIDHDFHIKNGKNKGAQRMWNKGGQLYIDTYFEEGGIQHGKQYRWYGDGTLARDAEFSHGKLIYEILYDKTGKETTRKGEKQ